MKREKKLDKRNCKNDLSLNQLECVDMSWYTPQIISWKMPSMKNYCKKVTIFGTSSQQASLNISSGLMR